MREEGAGSARVACPMGLLGWVVAGFGWELGKTAAKEAVDAAREPDEDAPSAAALERARKEREREAERTRKARAKEAKSREREIDRELEALKRSLKR